MFTTIVVAITLPLLSNLKPPTHQKPIELHSPVIVQQVKLAKPVKIKPLHTIKKLEPIKPKVVVKKAVEPIKSGSGCVSGYSTADKSLNQLISHESGGNSCATNAGGCYGLLQACPGEPLRSACGGDPDCQIKWFVANKTGGRSWGEIWSLWQTQGWW